MKYAIEHTNFLGYVVSLYLAHGTYKAVEFFDSLVDAVKYVKDHDADEYFVVHKNGRTDLYMKLSAYGNSYVCVC